MYEILAPAGNRECALAAIDSGADAIYLGYSAFSARASAENFDLSALKEIVDRAHVFGVKIYVTMNTMVKQSEVDEFLSTLLSVHNLGVDGILLQDIFLGKYIHEQYPDIVLHLSTQAGVNNVYGATLAKEYGFSRVVLARETALADIKEIAKIIETEVFVQGALCTCFSGQCYMSSFIGGYSGNRGRCKQPCRKRYTYRTRDNERNYALSLSDLCVGEKVKDLLEAGVFSLKIEGRMRRPEYVSAAVRYYKNILTERSEKDIATSLSALKRTYNRGNYTQGLTFGQDKRFLSTAVQGHIGEKVGVVKVINGKYYVESREQFVTGDGFKILRGGEEVGGGTFISSDKRGFFLGSRDRLKNGDSVFITTDTTLNAKLLPEHRKKQLRIMVKGQEGGTMSASCQGIERVSEFTLQTAKSSPMGEKDVIACFEKVDEYPFEVRLDVQIEGNCFVPKSQLNAFRRDFYAALFGRMTENKNTQYTYIPAEFTWVSGEERAGKTAVMGENLQNVKADIYIVKPSNYADLDKEDYPMPKFGEKYLYLPTFLSGEEITKMQARAEKFDGIYADGTYGIVLAKLWSKKLFAGTGFNLSNLCAVNQAEFNYMVVSKELDHEEQRAITKENAFVLSAGSLKLMDLIYCPFGKKCASCENKNSYILTDEGKRDFTVRRYKVEGACRFEVYNCAYLLAPQEFSNSLIDLSTVPMSAMKRVAEQFNEQEKVKGVLFPVTSGHSKKSVL